jgi:arylsulfatase A-like enzyme
VLFERAYSHVPLTLPAHTTLLSGRLPFETGVRDDTGFSVKPDEQMLPQMLRGRGFATGGVASAFALREATGIGQGFDFYDAEMPVVSPAVSAGPSERDGQDSERIAERWLDSQRSSRVFLFLHLNEPHSPYAPPERFGLLDPYDGEVAYADEIIGRLIDYLKSHRLYEQSTIVLLADHGEGLGDHGEQEHGLFLYDEAIHVPLIIKQAGNARAGSRVTDIVQQIDIVPTVLDLAKAPAPGNLQGRSLKPLLEGPADLPERAVYSETLATRYRFGWRGQTALTDAGGTTIHAPAGGETLSDPEDKRQILDAYRRALDLADARKWGEASALLQQVLTEDPRMIDAWDRLAAFSIREERFDQAVEAYTHLIELGGQARYAASEQAFIDTLKHFPQHTEAYAGLAALHQAGGRMEAAGQTLDQMLRAAPTPEAYGVATRLWTAFGNKKQADSVRAEARREFSPRAQERATQR